MDDEDGFRTTPVPRPPRQYPLLSAALEHGPLLATVVAALIFAFRCVVVTGGDPYTASLLLAQTSYGDAIGSFLFSVAPSLLFVISTVAAFVAAIRKRFDLVSVCLLAVAMTASLVAVYMSDRWAIGWITLLDILMPSLGFFWLIRAVAWPMREIESTPSASRLWTYNKTRQFRVILLVLAFISLAPNLIVAVDSLVSADFWLPRERLVFKGEAPFTGYVLKVSEDQLVILSDKPRLIIQKDGFSLADRDFCYPEDHKARSSKLAADLPVCP
jgi:hypothetical protein